MLIDFIAGAGYDLYKIAPLVEAIEKEQNAGKDFGYRIIYTGHRSDITGENILLGGDHIPQPNLFLETSENNAAEYTADVMLKYERILATNRPDFTLVVGDSTGAMACALIASKTHNLKVAHIEAGIKGPAKLSDADVNRLVIDSITDYNFSIAQSSNQHLRKSGVPDEQIYFVGNPLADFLMTTLPSILQPEVWAKRSLQPQRYFLLCLNHPYIINNRVRLKELLLNLLRVSKNLPILIPANSTLSKTLKVLGIRANNLHEIEPNSDADCYYLARYAKAVITDTDKLQDETTIMQVPCITLLAGVARPETVSVGTNEITGLQAVTITEAFDKLFSDTWKKGKTPYLWDGKTAARLVSVLNKIM